jgi:UTP-glucose-1-phosphate uridylyltransferase
MEKTTAIYLAAGLSSRFGGRIKALIKVGPNNETLLELSMIQAIKAGFNKFVIVVSDKTIEPIKDYFKESFREIPIKYAIQTTPEYREKPLGTSHALLSAKDMINEPFIILNSDDIYGVETLTKLVDYIINEKGYCLPGYKLKNSIPEQGTVNRGWIKPLEGLFVDVIEEQFNISMEDIPFKYSGEELISMNIFGLQPDFFEFLEKDFNDFKEKNKEDTKKEWLLLDSVTNFTKQTGTKVKVLPTDDIPIGVTNPEDEEIVRKKLKGSQF